MNLQKKAINRYKKNKIDELRKKEKLIAEALRPKLSEPISVRFEDTLLNQVDSHRKSREFSRAQMIKHGLTQYFLLADILD